VRSGVLGLVRVRASGALCEDWWGLARAGADGFGVVRPGVSTSGARVDWWVKSGLGMARLDVAGLGKAWIGWVRPGKVAWGEIRGMASHGVV